MLGPSSPSAGFSGQYEIPIRSRSVLRVYVQSGFNLQLSEGEDAGTGITIADPIAIVTENDPVLQVSAGVNLPAFGKIVVSGRELCDQRRLRITFAPGVWFRVEPRRPSSEEWGPVGSKGMIVVCMPGGEIVIWFGQHRRRNASVVPEAAQVIA